MGEFVFNHKWILLLIQYDFFYLLEVLGRTG